MKFSVICAVLLLTSSILLAQSTPNENLGSSGFLKLETLSNNRDLDAEAVRAVNDRLSNDPSMKSLLKEITVSSRNNVIYVSGKVTSNGEKLRVLDHARSISAANRVVDQLEITEPEATP